MPERGFRVISLARYFAGERDGDVFSVGDLALRRAKARAKAEGEDIAVLMDGRVKWCARSDGAIDHYEETRPA